MPGILSTDKKEGRCQICGKVGKLSVEHVIRKNAGGGEKTKLYDLTDVLEHEKKAHYHQKQNGLTATTICADCNNLLGRKYDEDFGKFYTLMNIGVEDTFQKAIKNKEITDRNGLIGRSITLSIKHIKPFNIAKRLLAIFCSIDHEDLTERMPEIRKAILNPDYKPNCKDFALFMALKAGTNDSFYATIYTFRNDHKIECFAGVESRYTCFYLKDKNRNKDFPDTFGEECINITNWLTDYELDKEYEIQFTFPFIATKVLNIPPDKRP